MSEIVHRTFAAMFWITAARIYFASDGVLRDGWVAGTVLFAAFLVMTVCGSVLWTAADKSR